jgi:hypothetical protein
MDDQLYQLISPEYLLLSDDIYESVDLGLQHVKKRIDQLSSNRIKKWIYKNRIDILITYREGLTALLLLDKYCAIRHIIEALVRQQIVGAYLAAH